MLEDDIATACLLVPPVDARIHAPTWLQESWQTPSVLMTKLQGLLDKVARTAAKSRAEGGFDLYHDMVTRHLGSGSTAFQSYDPHAVIGPRWPSLSYEQLHVGSTELAATWAAGGVSPGGKLAIVLPFGHRCVVAWMAGLRLGACVTWVEPTAPHALRSRLRAFAPDFIASDPLYGSALGAFSELLLSDEPTTAPPAPASYCYRPGELCAMLFSPLRRQPQLPVPLTGEDAFYGAMRDGLLALALRPGDRVAAPGFDDPQHQPALLFSTLLLGACFVHLELHHTLVEPELLGALELRTLGVQPSVVEALLRSRVRRPPWGHVFRNPEAPTDWEAWRDLVEVLELGDVAMSNVLFESARGGTILSSPRRPAPQHLSRLMHVSPSPGRAWVLLDFTSSGQRAAGDVGVFAPACEDDDSPYIVLARRRGLEYLYGGTTEPRRSGHVMPVNEMLDALTDCPFLSGASVASMPAGGTTLEQRFILVGFCGAEPRTRFDTLREARITEIRRVLGERLGPSYLPDRIELFPGFPRMSAHDIDHGWCRTQYLTGALTRKYHLPVFDCLTDLRVALIAAETHG